jgi:hypothetical protein
VYVALSGVVEQAGFPPIASLLVAIALVIIPFELTVVVRASRSSPGRRPAGIDPIPPRHLPA